MRLIVGIGLMVVAFVLLFLFIAGPENKLVADVMTALTCQPGERFTQVLGGYTYSSDGSGGQSFNFYCQSDAGKRDVTGIGVIIGIAGFVVPFLLGLALTIGGSIGRMGRYKQPVITTTGFTSSVITGDQTDPFGKPIKASDFQANVSGQPVHTATVITLNGKQGSLADLPPETAKMVEQALGRMSTVMNSADFGGQGGDISERLKQLQNAGVSPEKLKMIEQALHNFGAMNAAHFWSQGGDLSDKLKQLQDARDKGLITTEEYDRARKAILDHLGQE